MNTNSKEILAYLILKESEVMEEFEDSLWIKVNKEDYLEVFSSQVCKLCQNYEVNK